MRPCLTENELLALLTCDADDASTAEQSAHLESCPQCQAAADRLTEARELEPAFVRPLRAEHAASANAPSAAWISHLRAATADPSESRDATILETPFPGPGSTVDTEADSVPDACSVRDTPLDADPALGTTIGPYTLTAHLGQGGFGIVYQAEQHRPIRRTVALKVIKPGMDSREIIARFEAERQALALMDHPHIARIIDAGTTNGVRSLRDRDPDSDPSSLISHLSSPPAAPTSSWNSSPAGPSPTTATSTASQSKSAWNSSSPSARPCSTRIRRGSSTATSSLRTSSLRSATENRWSRSSTSASPRHSGRRWGTARPSPARRRWSARRSTMSPEQIGFGVVDVDTRSDVYSLGVLLYELLTGTTPFEKSRLQSSSLADWQRIVREEEPPRPSARLTALNETATTVAHCRESTPRELSRHIRGDLDWIVLKALEKDRDRRYETASALAHDLERLLAHEPVQARAPSHTYRLRKFIRRNRTVTVLAGLLVVALLAGTVVSAAFGIQARTALADMKQAQLGYKNEHDRAQQNLVNAAETVQRLLTRVAQEKLFTTPGGTHLRRELLIEAGQQMEALSEGQRDPHLLLRVAAAYRDIGTIHHHCGDFSSAAVELNRGLELLSSLPDSLEFRDAGLNEEAHLRTLLGEVYWYQDRHEEALAELDLAIASAESLCDKHLSAAPYLGLLEHSVRLRGLVKSTMASGDLGQKDFERALTLARALLADGSERDLHETVLNRLRIATNQLYMAILRSKRGKEETALTMFDEALTLMDSIDRALGTAVSAPDHSEVALNPLPAQLQVRFRKSEGLIWKGRCLLSLGENARAHECFAESVQVSEPIAQEFPDIFWTRTLLAHAYTSLAETGEHETAIVGLRRLVELNPNDARSRLSLGVALYDSGEADAGVDEYRRAIELDPHDAQAHCYLGDALFKRGDVNAAIDEFRRAIELKPDYAGAHYNLGVALSQNGECDAAIDEYRRAIELKPDYADAHYNLGVALSRNGECDAAIDEYRRAIELKPQHAKAHGNLALELEQMGDLNAAVDEHSRCIELDPDNPGLHRNFAISLWKKGDLDACIAELRLAIELKPDYTEALENLGNALRIKGDLVGAIVAYRQAIELKPDYADAHHNLGITLSRMGDMEAAVAEYRLAASLYPDELAKKPLLVADVTSNYRYNAACAVSVAAASADTPDRPLSDADRATWRAHARDWLTADLAAWQQLADATPDARPKIAKTLAHWQTDPDLVPVRDAEPLAQLPDAERQQWQALWRQVEQLRASLAAAPAAATH